MSDELPLDEKALNTMEFESNLAFAKTNLRDELRALIAQARAALTLRTALSEAREKLADAERIAKMNGDLNESWATKFEQAETRVALLEARLRAHGQHECMRCGGQFACPHAPGNCAAKYAVLPPLTGHTCPPGNLPTERTKP